MEKVIVATQQTQQIVSNSNNNNEADDDDDDVFDDDSLDPSLSDGWRGIQSGRIQLEVRAIDDAEQTVGNLVTLHYKLLVLYKEDGSIERVGVELNDEDDLYFLLSHSLDVQGFNVIQARQKLMVEFSDYPSILIKNFHKCVKEPYSCMAVLYIRQGGNARLDFIQNLEFKFVELLSIDFTQAAPETVKMHIMFRYFHIKRKYERLKKRMSEMNHLVRTKNASGLLNQQASNTSSNLSRTSQASPNKTPKKK